MGGEVTQEGGREEWKAKYIKGNGRMKGREEDAGRKEWRKGNKGEKIRRWEER